MKSNHFDRLADFPDPHLSYHVSTVQAPAETENDGDDRRARGERLLREVTGDAGEALIRGLREIAPDLADWIVEFSYGEVMARPGLDRRSRQLAAIAALTALGNAQPQLKAHIQGALRVGCGPQEIVEVILQMAVFAGFPAAINALEVARQVLPTRV